MQQDLAIALADHVAGTDGWHALLLVTGAVLPGLKAAVADARERRATTSASPRRERIGQPGAATSARVKSSPTNRRGAFRSDARA